MGKEIRKEEEGLERETNRQKQIERQKENTRYTNANTQTNRKPPADTLKHAHVIVGVGGSGPINTSLEQLCCVVWFPISRGHSCHTHAYSRFIYTNYIRLNVVALNCTYSAGWS